MSQKRADDMLDVGMKAYQKVVARKMAEQVPSIGRVVHFILDEGRSFGQHRPAIITRVWARADQVTPETAVQLQVFADGTNDDIQGGANVVWKSSRQYRDPSEQAAGTWHWPEYVSAK